MSLTDWIKSLTTSQYRHLLKQARKTAATESEHILILVHDLGLNFERICQ